MCGADDFAAIWRKRMTSLILADIGRKNGRKFMNSADHVRRFVRKWLEENRGKWKEMSGLCLNETQKADASASALKR